MTEVTKRSFPYPIHPAAVLGPLDPAVVAELITRIETFGYSKSEPLMLYRGSILDGRHRQKACEELGVDPPVKKVDLQGMTPHEWVLNRHHFRDISDKERAIFAIESFPEEGEKKLERRVGKLQVNIGDLRRLYQTATAREWNSFKVGKIKQKALAEKYGIYNKGKNRSEFQEEIGVLKGEKKTLEQNVSGLSGDVEMLQCDLDDRESRIKELEKRIKKLDPQERIARSAGDEADTEDRLRDRLEFTEDELKKSQKINEQFADKVRGLERLHHTFEKVFSNVDWGARAIAPPVRATDGQTRAHEFLALMSDAHYGEVVSPSEALGISYNCDIAKRRMEHYRDTIIRFKDLREPAYGIDKLTVAILGDMLSGNIHDELRVYNEKNMTEQSADMTRILKDFAFDFASEFPEVEFIIIPGNHPRLFRKPEFKKKWDNWETGVGDALQLAIEEGPLENVQITVPHSMVYIHEIFGQRIAMLHGDSIKSNSFAGIPFYGMRQRREGLQSLLSSQGIERADMLVMGHFHQHLYWSAECDILINGAIKGGDEYSIGSYLSAPEPMQVLLEFHPEHGLAAQEHISLGHVT